MNFQDIPKFIQTNNGHNESWTDLEHYINDRWDDIPGGFQLCPEFQRGHVWTEEQQIAYVEFCLKGGRSGKDIYINFMGYMDDFRGPILLVDGLQRITAVRRFMNNEIPVFGTYYKDFEGHLPSSTACFIFKINNLNTMKEVLQWYLEINDGGTPHTKEEIDRIKKMLEEVS